MLTVIGHTYEISWDKTKSGKQLILRFKTGKTPNEELHVWVPSRTVYGNVIKCDSTWHFVWIMRDKIGDAWTTTANGENLTTDDLKKWVEATKRSI